jgi:hypothetical protein
MAAPAALRLELACPHLGLCAYRMTCDHVETRGWYLPESGTPPDREGLIRWLQAHGLGCSLMCESALLARDRRN